MPPDPVVKPGIWFIENADPYADGAVPSVADPELKTLFRVNIPFMDPGVIGNGLSFIRRFGKSDGLTRASPGALGANRTHMGYPKFDGFVRNKPQVCKDFTNPDPGAKSGRN